MLITRTITDIKDELKMKGTCFGQQFLLHEGLKNFGDKGRKASAEEMKQLHDRVCFLPVSIKEMTELERRRAMIALMFLIEKRDGRIKGRMVYNGKPSREWLTREDSASPTALTESIMLTCAIEQKRV